MTETDVSSSFDLSDVEKEVEIHSLFANQKRPSIDLNGEPAYAKHKYNSE